MGTRGVNRVTLVGYLGRDPDFRHTRNGTAVCRISIATTDSWVKEGKKQERTEWHQITLWEGLAEIAAKYLKKGRQVYVEGAIETRQWKDKESGADRFTKEIRATMMQMLGGGRTDEPVFKDPDKLDK